MDCVSLEFKAHKWYTISKNLSGKKKGNIEYYTTYNTEYYTTWTMLGAFTYNLLVNFEISYKGYETLKER